LLFLVYDYPKQHPKLGTLSPDYDDLARALAGGDLVFPSGAVAANTLGLSSSSSVVMRHAIPEILQLVIASKHDDV
jgi:hypothetical protein